MWLYRPEHLYSSYKLFPDVDDSAEDVANSLTRLLILVVLVLWLKNYSVERVIMYGLIGIFVIYIVMTTKKENFSPITYKMNEPIDSNSIVAVPTPPPMPPMPPLAILQPAVENYREPAAHPSQLAQTQHYASQPEVENYREPAAHPSQQAQTHHYQKQPEVENYREPAAHPSQLAQTQHYQKQPEVENYREPSAHPSQQAQTHHYQKQPEVENYREQAAHPSVLRSYMSNYVKQHMNRNDKKESYREPVALPSYPVPESNQSVESVRNQSYQIPVEVHATSIQDIQFEEPTVTQHQKMMSVMRKSLQTIDEPTVYGTQATMHGQKFFTPNMGNNARIYQAPKIVPRMMDSDFSTVNTHQPTNFNPLQDMGMNDERHHFTRSSAKKSKGMLLERTNDDDDGYTAESVTAGNNKFYLQDIQPNVYSFSYDPTPINSGVGISYTPQIPPRTKTTIRTEDGKSYPMYTRIDPQLIREDVSPQRKEEMPARGEWSEGFQDGFAPQKNVVYDIYDPRFTGYGDEYRSYNDIHTGNVKYYYTDVDAYRSPNFVIRNKVDHVDLHEPMGNTYSSYPREAALEDVREVVNDDWLAKSTEHREDMMERIMRKSNARNWQMRFAPKSSGANLRTFSSGY